MKRICAAAGALALASFSATAQDGVEAKLTAEKAQLNDVLKRATLISVAGGVMANIKGAPYSAEKITENTQTLGDGTRIHHESAVKVFRDNDGRVRQETPETITIFDPVAGVGYTLNPVTLTGSKMTLSVSSNGSLSKFSYTASSGTGEPRSIQLFSGTDGATMAGGGGGISVSTSTSGGNAERTLGETDGRVPEAIRKGLVGAGGVGVGAGGGVGTGVSSGVNGSFTYSVSGSNVAYTKTAPGKLDDLGTKNMEGVTVQGERRTQTIAAGEIGNDREIQIVNERWYSPELQLEVMTRHSDPRSGEQITSLVNIRRTAPDASLFQLPAAYTISEPKWMPTMVKDRQ
jgi:hypothetical protein